MSQQKMSRILNSAPLFLVAVLFGVMLAVGASVLATSIGSDVGVSNTLTVNGNSTFGDSSGDINIFTGTLQASTTALFTGTATFYGSVSLASAGGGLGVGVSTTTAGALETSGAGLVGGAFNVTGVTSLNGNVTIGATGSNTFTVNSNSVTYGNVSTSTIPASNANSWAIATSSAGVPMVKINTSTSRIGIGSTTPGASLAIGNEGTMVIMGAGTSTISVQSTGGANKGGCIELEGAAGTAAVFRLYATTSGLAIFESGSCQ